MAFNWAVSSVSIWPCLQIARRRRSLYSRRKGKMSAVEARAAVMIEKIMETIDPFP